MATGACRHRCGAMPSFESPQPHHNHHGAGHARLRDSATPRSHGAPPTCVDVRTSRHPASECSPYCAYVRSSLSADAFGSLSVCRRKAPSHSGYGPARHSRREAFTGSATAMWRQMSLSNARRGPGGAGELRFGARAKRPRLPPGRGGGGVHGSVSRDDAAHGEVSSQCLMSSARHSAARVG